MPTVVLAGCAPFGDEGFCAGCRLASMYKVHDAGCIQLFGFHTAFGGGRSAGFGLIYENKDALIVNSL